MGASANAASNRPRFLPAQPRAHHLLSLGFGSAGRDVDQYRCSHRKPRTLPVLGLPDGDRLVVIASNYGRPNNPGWYYNLLAHPQAVVTWEGSSIQMQARELKGEERKLISPVVFRPIHGGSNTTAALRPEKSRSSCLSPRRTLVTGQFRHRGPITVCLVHRPSVIRERRAPRVLDSSASTSISASCTSQPWLAWPLIQLTHLGYGGAGTRRGTSVLDEFHDSAKEADPGSKDLGRPGQRSRDSFVDLGNLTIRLSGSASKVGTVESSFNAQSVSGRSAPGPSHSHRNPEVPSINDQRV